MIVSLITEVFSPAVCPDDVYSARGINFSGGKVRRTNVAGMTIIEYLCSKERIAPGITTIGGPDRQDRVLSTSVYWDDDRTIRLHDRLSANDAGLGGV